MNIGLVAEQMIQGCRVGKGGVFSNRGIETLLFSVRAKGRGIEGDHGGPAGLGTGHALDGGVGRRGYIRLSGDQALLGLPLCLAVAGIPGLPDPGIFLGIVFPYPEHQVAAL